MNVKIVFLSISILFESQISEDYGKKVRSELYLFWFACRLILVRILNKYAYCPSTADIIKQNKLIYIARSNQVIFYNCISLEYTIVFIHYIQSSL